MIRPLRNYIVVQRNEAPDTSPGGIILTQADKEIPTEGLVIACGNGALERGERVPLEVDVGDVVLFPHFAGKEIRSDGESYLIMLDSDVYAVVE